MDYKVGDTVVVFGSKTTGTKNSCNAFFCTVIAVGNKDLFCEHVSRIKMKKVFRVSKARCLRLPKFNLRHDEAEITRPALGDLVMSITERIGGEREEITGIVEEMTYEPTQYEMREVTIRSGTKRHAVKESSVIVLETSRK
tara:strand:- start:104 stop:526 length:423 start_codon:yes stop_codon:yes gene_type:complete